MMRIKRPEKWKTETKHRKLLCFGRDGGKYAKNSIVGVIDALQSDPGG